MNKSSKIILAVVAVLVVAAALVFLMAGSKGKKTESKVDVANTSAKESTDQPKTDQETVAATITYTNDGFSPSSVTVNSGDKIKFINNSDSRAEPSSDPHPVHTDNPELNVGDLEPGQSANITVEAKGTWGMHNHYNPSRKTTVIVK